MDVQDLMTRCSAQDPRAWEDLIKLYTPLVRKSVNYKFKKLGLTRWHNAVNDVCQDVFLKIWEKNALSRLRDTAALEAWLAMVAINTAHNYCARNIFLKNSRDVSLDRVIVPEATGFTLHRSIASPEKDPLSSLEQEELRRALEKALSSMPAKKRLALQFFYYDGKKQKDIARIMSMPLSTAGTLLKRAREELAEKIKKILKEKRG